MSQDADQIDYNSAGFEPKDDDIFGRIAKDYDRYCDYFSLYIHRLWKRAFTQTIAAEAGTRLLDLASGTGDIPLRLLNHAKDRSLSINVTDISVPMLDIAKQKLKAYEGVTYSLIDACHMPEVPSRHYDIITMAFGMKIIDRAQAMAEIHRCLKPGGVFLCIEASRIPVAWLHSLYLSYMNLCLPLMGALVAKGDASTYNYLLRGIHDFPDGATFAHELQSHGFDKVSVKSLSLGIVAIHTARKPAR